jgi:two-component system, NtrC family, response regulator HydG
VNGHRVEARVALGDGDVIRIGSFHARVEIGDGTAAPTETAQPEARGEEIVAADDALTVSRPSLVIVSGPGESKRIPLKGSRIGIGGPGSRIELPDPTLVRNHFYLRFALGRTMLEPGSGSVQLGPTRVRDIVPLDHGEVARAGNTELSVEWETTADRPTADRFGEMVGAAPEMQKIFGMLRRMAAHHAPVLLIGESGTGKELAARALHDASPRAASRFVALNCGAISQSLFESELFGHEKGAFTGADQKRDGAFQRADGGTLFLDEIGELPEDAQSKLLRALESGEVRRVGGAEPSFPDVRIVAATNRNLSEEVRAGRFRSDLYFRLAVLAVRIPPLRERPEDIPVIAHAIAAGVSREIHLSAGALAEMAAYPWPGNAREMRNVLTRAYVMTGPIIDAEHLLFSPLEEKPAQPIVASRIEETERDMILDAVRRAGGNRSRAARLLGIPRSSLLYKLEKWGVE